MDALVDERGPGWLVPPPLDGRLDEVLAVVAAHELEGIVAKHSDSPYAEGRRSRHWLKHKLRRTERLTITGWDPARWRRPARRLPPVARATTGQ